MHSTIITGTFLALQLTLIQYLPYSSCQQFTFNSNAPIPQRFLVPGAFAASSAQNQPVQSKRVLLPSPQQQSQQSVDDETLRRFRKPAIIRPRPGVGSPTHNFALDQEPIFADHTPRIIPTREDDSPSDSTGDNLEDKTEEVFASPSLSTFEPTPINTLPLRTIKQSTLQSRPTRPPSPSASSFVPSSPTPPQFFRPSTNLLEEDEEGEETHNLETSPSPFPSTEGTTMAPRRPIVQNTAQQYQRKPTPIHRINTIQSRPNRIQLQSQPQPQPSEFTDNKIVRQYEKVPAKSKFEKAEVSEKRPKKPVAQVLRRYREDNPDGSITWGFENDDGSYKEEIIGNDCMTRGKYGYIDPDGVRREYTYSQGLPCDKTKTEQEDDEKSGSYIDYTRNKVVLANGESVDIDNMVKNRQRKPVANVRN